MPTFNGFSLQDSTYITKVVNYRSRATRNLESEIISRRIGKKIVNEQILEKVITIQGIINTASPTALQTAVDNLLQNLSKVESTLVIDTGRMITATATRINIPDRTYSQTMVPFEVEFVAVKPYAEAELEQAHFIVTSGTNSLQINTTISGTVANRPSFSFVLPSGVGTSPVVEIDVQYVGTGNIITASGTFTAEKTLVFNYDNFIVTNDGNNYDYVGQFDDIEPGSASFIVTVSGKNDGIRGTLEYNSRYW